MSHCNALDDKETSDESLQCMDDWESSDESLQCIGRLGVFR